MRCSSDASICERATGAERMSLELLPKGAAEDERLPVATRSSTKEFHAPQAGQRPSHFGDSLPHWEQNQTVFSFCRAKGVL